ncbi:hypothetical protein Pan241w_60210 [Gimesia alba]|uniref:Uncharacterized protein n=1 Tax=Gimesia alba TaxID=2527973 RepID=A0A517RPT4_9PLAN|nr:hypothetical protein [Gimesia alba]QDT45893.1 hypothetical protein Pan241w_60210 [Gimesia alba]
MLIVLTQDQAVIDWVNDPRSNSAAWGTVEILNQGGNPAATVAMRALLRQIRVGEVLCITGHGNDSEVGDANLNGPASWSWNVSQLADLLIANLPAGYTGPILMEVCADSMTSFAAALCVELERRGELIGLTIYGYTRAVSITHSFPSPDGLDHNVELTAHVVSGGNAVSLALKAGGTPPPTPPAKKWPARTLKSPSSNAAKYNQPAEKYYVFNETGNVMLSSTEPVTSQINPSAQELFEEVAVFFAAMTKAITSLPKPGATPPYKFSDYYSIYDYEALDALVNRSGLFVNVHKEDLHFHKDTISATFNIEFIEAVLGVVLTDGVGAAALMASLNAMGKQASVSYSRTSKHHKIGNLLFVCEYLFGMPLVNVLYFYLDEDQVKTVVDVSPCVKVQKGSFDLQLHKDTFLFVVPNWIRKYAGDLASIADDSEYQLLVNELQAYISNTPLILSVQDATGPVTELKDGSAYTLNGINLGKTPGSISIAGTDQTLATGSTNWTEISISFTAKKPTSGTGGPIVIKTGGKPPQVAESHTDYTFS